MKAKLTRLDGTVIEIEGDAAHVQAALVALSPSPWPALNTGFVPNPLAGGGAGLGGVVLPQGGPMFKSVP